jgi:hypothetical protein
MIRREEGVCLVSLIKWFVHPSTSIQPPRNLKHLSGSKAQALSGRQGIRYLIAAPYRCLACPRKSFRLRARTLCLSTTLYQPSTCLSTDSFIIVSSISLALSSNPQRNPPSHATRLQSSTIVSRTRHWTTNPLTLSQSSMLQVANPPSERIHQAHFQPRQQSSHPPFTLSVTRPSSATNDSPGHHKYGSAHIPALAALASLAASAPAAPVKRESIR